MASINDGSRNLNLTSKLERGSRPPQALFDLDYIPVISSKLQAAGYSNKIISNTSGRVAGLARHFAVLPSLLCALKIYFILDLVYKPTFRPVILIRAVAYNY
jgi:hypothetical protein